MIADQHSTGQMPPVSEHRHGKRGHGQKSKTGVGKGETTPLGGVKLLLRQVRELEEYFLHFVAAKTDLLKVSLRSTVLEVAQGALWFVAISGSLVIAAWFVLSGLAGGLGVLFGGRLWLGELMAGILFLAGLGLGMHFAVGKNKKSFLERMVAKYEARRAQQQSEFGRSASDRAARTVE